jgi:hypothetical protein
MQAHSLVLRARFRFKCFCCSGGGCSTKMASPFRSAPPSSLPILPLSLLPLLRRDSPASVIDSQLLRSAGDDDDANMLEKNEAAVENVAGPAEIADGFRHQSAAGNGLA